MKLQVLQKKKSTTAASQIKTWKAVVNSFQKLQMTDSFICSQLGVLIAVWSEYCTKVKQNCLSPLVSEITLLNRLLTRTEEPHQGANMSIFTFVLTSLCSRSKALGKLPVDRALHRPDYHLSKYSKGREACASHSLSLSTCTASKLVNKLSSTFIPGQT